METHSSLFLHLRDIGIRAVLVMLAAAPITSCGGDDTTPPGNTGGASGTGGSGGSSGASVDGGEHDASPQSDGATTTDGARADTSSDLSNSDRANGTDTSTRDTATTPDVIVVDTGTKSDVTTIDTRAPDTTAGDTTTTIDVGSNDTTVPPTDGSAPTCSICATYGAAKQLGKVTNATLNNLSGITASHINANVLYVHNDMSASQFYALSSAAGSEAALLGTYTLSGVTVSDIEDIAVGPCGTESCVYIADIGGNVSPRTEFGIVRAPEPTVQIGQSPATLTLAAEKLTFKYPDGANHNAESLVVDPASGTVYIITKVAAGMPSTVYRLGSTFGGATVTAEKIIDLTVPKSTDKEASGASAHPCAPAFLLRTYNTLYEFRAPAGSPFEAAFQATPVVVPAATETQGEGVAYARDGQSYVTTTEGASPAINVVTCQ